MEPDKVSVDDICKAFRLGRKFRTEIGPLVCRPRKIVEPKFPDKATRRLASKIVKLHLNFLTSLGFLPLPVQILVVKAFVRFDEIECFEVHQSQAFLAFSIAAKEWMDANDEDDEE